MGRILIYVPILHTVSDMGDLGGSMLEAYVNKFGEKKWQEHLRVITELWDEIAKRLNALNLAFPRVKLYQDGLPICGREDEIVRELAERGSVNHQLLLSLMNRGATLVGTEDPALLVCEYNHLKRIAHSRSRKERKRFVREFKSEEKELLKKRDEKIRERIVETLKADETGILFLGLLHRVDELLPPEIQVRYLIRLPFRESP